MIYATKVLRSRPKETRPTFPLSGTERGSGGEDSLAQRAREHRNRADRAHPEHERPLDEVADAALETGLERREAHLHLVPHLGDIRPKLRVHIGEIAARRVPQLGQIAPRRDVAHVSVHLMHPIHKLGALLSSEGTYARRTRRSISFRRDRENAQLKRDQDSIWAVR